MSWFASQDVHFYYLVFVAWKVTRTFKKRASAGFPVKKLNFKETLFIDRITRLFEHHRILNIFMHKANKRA